MAQIAERAGVALSTVSYVLSGKRSVSKPMRDRVLAAVEELDYRPHGPARALASGATHTIALFMPSPQWPLVPVQQTFVAGATQATSARDYALLLSTAATDPESIVRLVARGRADGVILMETLRDDPRVDRLRSAGYPFSLIGRTADLDGVSYVDMDFGGAVETGLDHLAGLGHTCVALFNFPPDLIEAGYTASLIARDVFESRTRELGIRGIHVPCAHAPRDAFAVAAGLLHAEPECTAAITTGWQFTGLLSALRAADLHVPDDFSVVSVIAAQFAEMLTPSLTGVDWPAFEAGRMAAEMLIDRLTGKEQAARQYLTPAELVVRESTGPAPRTRRSTARRRRAPAG
ncbi:MAG TPA: LacI family DNA-binding transcriptional regulator [Gaiellaceae bacterium]|nr:LacI family DNA-binding transcriptional regulator [Gaiellaceae bacterium]